VCLLTVHYSECLTKKALDGLGDFNIRGQVIQTVKYAHDLALMAKEEAVLQGTIDKINGSGRCYGMEMNVKKREINENSKTTIPVTIMIDQNQLQNVEFFKYLGSMLINDGRGMCEIKSRIAMAKAAFNKKKTFYQHIGLKFEEEIRTLLYLEHGFVWC